MWVIADYEPVAVFGLRPSNTTSSGGKSLLIPTPYAIKMALLDRAIRFDGLNAGRAYFPAVRDLDVAMRGPDAVAVNRTFQKVLRPGDKNRVWTETIAQREYCVHTGVMSLALHTADDTFAAEALPRLLSMVNYFGRRGGFFQCVDLRWSETLPDASYVDLGQPVDLSQLVPGFLQRMDDMRRDADFEEVSTFSKKGTKDDGGRRSYTVILPYVVRYHGHNHTVYERTPVLS